MIYLKFLFILCALSIQTFSFSQESMFSLVIGHTGIIKGPEFKNIEIGEGEEFANFDIGLSYKLNNTPVEVYSGFIFDFRENSSLDFGIRCGIGQSVNHYSLLVNFIYLNYIGGLDEFGIGFDVGRTIIKSLRVFIGIESVRGGRIGASYTF